MTDESLNAPLPDHARALLEDNAYLTLSTIGFDGQPWTSPVYMAADGLADFYWVSNLASRHSVNVEAHPAVSLVVFDSTVPAYHGRALYAVGTASVVDESEVEHGLRVYPGPPSRGGSAMTPEDVTSESPYRLYRARASQVWVLCPREPRQPCPLHGRAEDHRELVHPRLDFVPRTDNSPALAVRAGHEVETGGAGMSRADGIRKHGVGDPEHN